MRYYLLVVMILLAVQATAQQSSVPDKTKFGIIIGNLVEAAKGKAIPLARIDLYKTSTDSLLYSTITDKNGAFEFNHL